MLAYGRGPQSLSEQLGITLEAAKEAIELYFKTYPDIARWLEETSRYAVQNRFAVDPIGRIRHFAFNPGDRKEVASVRRESKNFPIQAVNADVIKLALFYCHCYFPFGGAVKIVNVIHDEINAECPPDMAEFVHHKIKELMETAGNEIITDVPILADAIYGENWGIKE